MFGVSHEHGYQQPRSSLSADQGILGGVYKLRFQFLQNFFPPPLA